MTPKKLIEREKVCEKEGHAWAEGDNGDECGCCGLKAENTKCDYCDEPANTSITGGDEIFNMCESCEEHYLG